MKHIILLLTLLTSNIVYSKETMIKKVILQKLLAKYCTKNNVVKNDQREWIGTYSTGYRKSHSFSCSNKINLSLSSKTDKSFHYIAIDADDTQKKTYNILILSDQDLTYKKYIAILKNLNAIKINSPTYKTESLSDYKKALEKKNQDRDNLLKELLK